MKCGGIHLSPLGSGVCGAAWSALEPVPTSAQMCSTGKALQSKAESLGTPGSVSRQDLCLGRGVVFSQKLGWQQLPSQSCAGGLWDILLLQELNLLNY